MARFVVRITNPEGFTRGVECDSMSECLDVLSVEALSSPRHTILSIYESRRQIARWGIGRNGLVRGTVSKKTRKAGFT